ncbi:hypothetical protein [Aphanothece sacrum]|uniref:Uncharacterized protein n=1 Tax=Aphanothece sacrum FPU1 TaxID=1920663 RepID=A0A401IFS5_APHSA|nr:hypothetical protein [Aphanothece sacrum]GBF80142.1 hypothetical protein AsFPU1_1543 [Aphanothece sacrum FPU1]GBF86389.1 hypothetical protein AsFPU3_3460 [Aphanothece sacrum FPU3]
MLIATQLQKDFENLVREDTLFDDYFKHWVNHPDKYLDRLEQLLFEDSVDFIKICRNIPENISYFLNRICCYFINHLGLDRRFRNDLYSSLTRLINILENAASKPVISSSLQPFFTKVRIIEGEPETPTAFERIKLAVDKYKKLEDDTEPNWKRKQRLGQRLIRYPHLYGSYLGASDNTTFGQTTQVRQSQYINNYTVDLHRYLRQETMKDNNKDLADSFAVGSVGKNWDNPTQLKKVNLYKSIYYYKKTESKFKERSLFVTGHYEKTSLLECKLMIYQVIVSLFPPEYQKAFVTQKLLASLQGQEASYNNKNAELALIKTAIDYCFKLLVIDDDKNHFFFIDMISNMGAKKTLNIFLQLIHCYPIDPHSKDQQDKKQRMLIALEKRLAMLFKNYEDFDETEMAWLINFLEYFHIATALQFDGLDLGGIKIPSDVLNAG